MDCSDCKNNLNCRIVRTFKTVDLTLKMHETPAYNYSYIYPLYGYILLELTNNSLMKLCKKFNEEYDLKLKYKKIAFLFQLSILYTHKKEYEEYIHEELKKCLTLNKKYLKKIYTFFFDNIESSIKDFKKILFYLFIPVPELRRNIKFC